MLYTRVIVEVDASSEQQARDLATFDYPVPLRRQAFTVVRETPPHVADIFDVTVVKPKA